MSSKVKKFVPIVAILISAMLGMSSAFAAWSILKSTTPATGNIHVVAQGDFSAMLTEASAVAYNVGTELTTLNGGHTTANPSGGMMLTAIKSPNFDLTQVPSVTMKVAISPVATTGENHITTLPTDSSWNPVLKYGFCSVTSGGIVGIYKDDAGSTGGVVDFSGIVPYWSDSAYLNTAPAWTKTASEWSTTIVFTGASLPQDGLKSVVWKQIMPNSPTQPADTTQLDKNPDSVFLWLDRNESAFDTMANWNKDIQFQVVITWSASG